MILSELKQALVDAVKDRPGSSSWEIAECLGIDPSNAGRDLKQLGRDGVVDGQQETGGRRTIRWYAASATQSQSSVDITPAGATEQIEDAIFTPLPSSRPPSGSPSTGRALVPVNTPSAPLDSRMEAALRQHAEARRRAAQGRPTGIRVAGQTVRALDDLFKIDPDGDHTLLAVQRAALANEREALSQEREQTKALTVRPPEPPAPTWAEFIGGVLAIGAKGLELQQGMACRAAEERKAYSEPSGLNHDNQPDEQKPPERELVSGDFQELPKEDGRDPIAEPDPSDFDYDELKEINDKSRQRVGAEPAPKGSIDNSHDVGDGVVDPRTAWGQRPKFAQRLAAAREEVARELATKQAARKQVVSWFASAAHKKVSELENTPPEPEPVSLPQNPPKKTWGRWIAERLGAGTPAKGVFR